MKLVKAITQSDLFEIVKIRTVVFVNEQNIDPLLEFDDEDNTCIHYLLTYNNKAVGCARIIKHDSYWQIGRIAVLKNKRHLHFGSFILEELEKIAKKENVHKLKLGAQVRAIPFYEKNGYCVCGDEYLDADIPHRYMEKVI